MTKEPELVQSRTISGKGVLLMPENNIDWRNFTLVSTVLRLSMSRSANFNYNPVKSGFGILVFLREGNVVDTKEITFENQSWDFYNDQPGETLIAVQCMYEGILETFENLGTALGTPPIITENLISEYANYQSIWDTVKLVCFADTQILLELYATDYDACGDLPKKKNKPPKKKDNPPPKKPPGTPADDNSPPYDEPDDSGDTVPFPGDSPPDPDAPQGIPCEQWLIGYTYDIKQVSTGNLTPNTREYTVWAQVGAVEIVVPSGSGSAIKIECQGIIQQRDGSGTVLSNPNQSCGEFMSRVADEFGFNPAQFVPDNLVITKKEKKP